MKPVPSRRMPKTSGRRRTKEGTVPLNFVLTESEASHLNEALARTGESRSEAVRKALRLAGYLPKLQAGPKEEPS